MTSVVDFTARQGRRRKTDYRVLAQELIMLRGDNPSPFPAPALAQDYPLELLESWTLIYALGRWAHLAGDDGVFVEGVHGRSSDLPDREPLLFPEFSTLTEIDDDLAPAQWSFLHVGAGFRRLQEQKIFGSKVASYPSPTVRSASTDSYLALIARRAPAVTRITGFGFPGFNCYDRLWLPIASSEDGPLCRFITVTEPLVRIME